MRRPDQLLGMYLHLARASQMRRQPMVRDKLLVLAGVTAADMGLDEISALCRERILLSNGWHLVRRWPTLRAATEDPRFQSYFKQLSRRYSPEKAEHMLERLGIEMARERDAYFTDHEYAAALLGASVHVRQAAPATEAASAALPLVRSAKGIAASALAPPKARFRRIGWRRLRLRRKSDLPTLSLVLFGAIVLGLIVILLVVTFSRLPR